MPLGLLRMLGEVPSYHLLYHYFHDVVLAEERRESRRAAVVTTIESGLPEMNADPLGSRRPTLLDQRGGAYYSEAVEVAAQVDTHAIQVEPGSPLPAAARLIAANVEHLSWAR